MINIMDFNFQVPTSEQIWLQDSKDIKKGKIKICWGLGKKLTFNGFEVSDLWLQNVISFAA
jgi:hypothetical protein